MLFSRSNRAHLITIHCLGSNSILGNVQPGRERSKKKKKKSSPRSPSEAESVEGESNFFESSNSPEPLTVP